ncbi:MAG TPA: HlyD family efflux transporter periplasmic adaptor subunit [Thermoanaerobaculia bacterium]|nr:HlyD family efflux transporter periplasmic adaptor subunit [Thermoanaerobaculia bacterium]
MNVSRESTSGRDRISRGAARCRCVAAKAAVAGLLVVLAAACGKGRAREGAEAAPADAPARAVHCLGRVVPGEKVLALAAPPQSVVKELLVRRNDRVRKGQALVVFRSFDAADAAARQAEAEVRVAEVLLAQARGEEKLSAIAALEAGLERARREVEKAKADRARAERLRAEGLLPESDREAAELDLRRAETTEEEASRRLVALRTSRPTEIAVAERRLASAKAALERARAEADLCVLRAPIDGVVLDVAAWPGETVGTRGVLDLGDTDAMRVEAEVYVTDVARVRVGSPVRVRGDGVPGELSGRVTEVVGQVGGNALREADPNSWADRRVVKVLVRLDEGRTLASLSNAQVDVTIGP